MRFHSWLPIIFSPLSGILPVVPSGFGRTPGTFCTLKVYFMRAKFIAVVIVFWRVIIGGFSSPLGEKVSERKDPSIFCTQDWGVVFRRSIAGKGDQ